MDDAFGALREGTAAACHRLFPPFPPLPFFELAGRWPVPYEFVAGLQRHPQPRLLCCHPGMQMHCLVGGDVGKKGLSDQGTDKPALPSISLTFIPSSCTHTRTQTNALHRHGHENKVALCKPRHW